MDSGNRKPVRWVGTSYRDWKKFPSEVQDVMGYALDRAQQGKKAENVKPLKGFRGASTLQIVDDFNTDTYRGIYTVQFKGAVYVLHAFKKKSKSGIATPPSVVALI